MEICALEYRQLRWLPVFFCLYVYFFVQREKFFLRCIWLIISGFVLLWGIFWGVRDEFFSKMVDFGMRLGHYSNCK